MKLERVLQGTAATIHVTFTQDGVPADPDPDSATVTLTRLSDGTTLGPYDCYDQGEGRFSHTLTPTESAQLDTLTAAWTVTYGDYPQTVATTVEVVGGFVFSLAQARATSGFDQKFNNGVYRISNARITEARTEVERMLEHELGFAMVPRFTQGTVASGGGYALEVAPYLRAVRSVTADGSPWPEGRIADLAFNPSNPGGYVYAASRWSDRYVTVGYEHGAPYPPPGAADVALKLARALVMSTPADDKAASMSTDEQTTTFYVPGASEPFALPAANRFVQSHSLRAGIA